MTTAQHGRKVRILLDMSDDADGVPVLVPMVVDWSTDRATDDVETTHADSENKEYVAGFPDYKGQFTANQDLDSDLLYKAADGKARLHYLYPNRDAAAGKKKYNYGKIILAVSEDGGVTKKIGQSVTYKAAGIITRGVI